MNFLEREYIYALDETDGVSSIDSSRSTDIVRAGCRLHQYRIRKDREGRISSDLPTKIEVETFLLDDSDVYSNLDHGLSHLTKRLPTLLTIRLRLDRRHRRVLAIH